MIDVENLVINTIHNALGNDVYVTSEYTETPPSFPCVFVTEEDNTVYTESQDSSGGEHHARVMYSVSVFSNKQEGKKSEAKTIMETVDEAFLSMNFTRTMKTPVPNVDRSIYRIEARYEAIIEEGRTNGNDTMYQVYRS